MKNVAVLGSTGSVGRQTLEVIAAHPEEFKVTALGCRSDVALLEEQIATFSPKYAAVVDTEKGQYLKNRLGSRVKIFYGPDSLSKIATFPEVEIVVVAVVGAAGILPVIHAIRAGKDIAIATKEVMVAAGDLVNSEVRKRKVKLIPVDSEHSAIFQCLHTGDKKEVGKVILTCSGGAFRGKKRNDLKNVTIKDALKHPNWKMGTKITVDCATLMNKGLEAIEAQKLFDLDPSQIQIVVHPQSIIHSMVEFIDGNIISQMGPRDMRFPIRYALSYPKRLKNHFHFLDLLSIDKLTFEEPDLDTFECLSLALKAERAGGTTPTALNAANEEAVFAFLDQKIKFLEISEVVRSVLEAHQRKEVDSLETVLEEDRKAREKAKKKIKELS